MQTTARGNVKLLVGRCRMASTVTTEVSEVEFAAIHPWNAQVCLRVAQPDVPPDTVASAEEMRAAFEKDDLAAVLRLMRERFGDRRLEIKNLIRDERQKIFDGLLDAAGKELDRMHRQMSDTIAPVVDSMLDCGMAPPPRFAAIAGAQLHLRMLDEFRARPVCVERIRALMATADARNVKWDRNMLEPKIRQIMEQLAREFRLSSESPDALRNLVAAVRAEQILPFAVDLHETQTQYYFLLENYYPGLRTAAEKDAADAARFEEFRALGTLLSMKVE